MWRLYMVGHGLAMVSTYARMREALGGDDHIFVGGVKYADYDLDFIPERDSFAPFMHKRISYEHECEVRAVIGHFPTRLDPEAENGRVLDYSLPSPSGLAVPARLDVLIDRVYVSPDAPPWFFDAVRDLTARYGSGFPVLQSRLGVDPVY